jgi:putative hemolysin
MSSLPVLALVGCLILVALLAASEAALAATNRVRLRHLLRAQNSEETGSDLSRESQNFIASVTIATNFPLIAAASLSVCIGFDQFGAKGAMIGTVICAIVALVIFQIAPRLLVSAKALENPWWARSARGLVALLRPLVTLFLFIGQLLLSPLGLLDEPKNASTDKNDEEIRDLVEAANQTGALDESKELIESIFTFGDTNVHEVMIPRPDIIGLPHDVTPQKAIETFEETGLSRLPIYKGSKDEILGILHVKDVLLSLQNNGTDFSPLQLMRQPLYVPETQKIDAALTSMRAKKTHLAIVMDEYGGTAGLLTVEDILEELVGEIADEHDRGDDSLLVLNHKNAIVEARLHAEDLKERWGLSLPVVEFETVGGFMIETLGRELNVGDQLEIPGALLTVHSVRSRRPHRIFITRYDATGEKSESSS